MRVFREHCAKRIFGLEKHKVAGSWRKLQEELSNLYFLPNIIRVVRPRKLRGMGHVAVDSSGLGWGQWWAPFNVEMILRVV